MIPRLNLWTLARLPTDVRRPDYDFQHLGVGIVHLGMGAFHRAHQAVFTEDAIRACGGDWGILGASLRRAAASEALAAQDHLYTVETLGSTMEYRVMAAIRASVCAPAKSPSCARSAFGRWAVIRSRVPSRAARRLCRRSSARCC